MSGLPSEVEKEWGPAIAFLQRIYPWHRFGFISFNVILTVFNIATGPPWWGLWPFLITGLFFAIHYLIYKASVIDEEWVDERAADLYYKSYDQGHIDSIADRNEMEKVNDRLIAEMRQRRAEASKKDQG